MAQANLKAASLLEKDAHSFMYNLNIPIKAQRKTDYRVMIALSHCLSEPLIEQYFYVCTDINLGQCSAFQVTW